MRPATTLCRASHTTTKPGLLIVDFDDTCTTHDTTTNVISTAIQDAIDAGHPPAPLHHLHAQLVAQYATQQEQLLYKLLRASPTNLDEFTNQLHAFNRRMNDAVVDSGILRHVRLASLRDAGVCLDAQYATIFSM